MCHAYVACQIIPECMKDSEHVTNTHVSQAQTHSKNERHIPLVAKLHVFMSIHQI